MFIVYTNIWKQSTPHKQLDPIFFHNLCKERFCCMHIQGIPGEFIPNFKLLQKGSYVSNSVADKTFKAGIDVCQLLRVDNIISATEKRCPCLATFVLLCI